MKHKKVYLIFILISAIITLSACDNLPFFNKEESDSEPSIVEEVDPNFPLEVAGVEITHQPERVVVLSASLLEQVYDLGLGDTVIGVPEYADYPPEVADLETCGSSTMPDVESIEGLRADLLITNTDVSVSDRTILEEDGVIILVLAPADNFNALLENYKHLALAIAGAQDGEELGSDFTQKLSAWYNELCTVAQESAEDRTSVLYLRHMELTVATGDTLEGKLLTDVGFDNPAEEYTNWTIPKEEFESGELKKTFSGIGYYLFGDPDVNIKMLEKSALYKGLNATLKDKYILIDYTVFERQSLRTFEQLGYIVGEIYPDAQIPSFPFDETFEPPQKENA